MSGNSQWNQNQKRPGWQPIQQNQSQFPQQQQNQMMGNMQTGTQSQLQQQQQQQQQNQWSSQNPAPVQPSFTPITNQTPAQQPTQFANSQVHPSQNFPNQGTASRMPQGSSQVQPQFQTPGQHQTKGGWQQQQQTPGQQVSDQRSAASNFPVQQQQQQPRAQALPPTAPPQPQLGTDFRNHQSPVYGQVKPPTHQSHLSGSSVQKSSTGIDSSAMEIQSHQRSSAISSQFDQQNSQVMLQTQLQQKTQELQSAKDQAANLLQDKKNLEAIYQTKIQDLQKEKEEVIKENANMIKEKERLANMGNIEDLNQNLLQKDLEIKTLQKEIETLKNQILELNQGAGTDREMAEKLALKEEEEAKKREETKFHIVCDLPAPKPIRMQDVEGLIRFQERPWKDFRGNQSNQINIRQCWHVQNLAQQYHAMIFQRFTDQISAKGYTHYRSVRGDGNCFWRSVSYTYLEKLIYNQRVQEIRNLASNVFWGENPYYQMDDPILVPGVSDKIEKMDCAELVKVLCGHLLQLAQSLEETSRNETLLLQQKMYFQNPKFDKAMIYMLRKLTKNFILLNQEAQINGFEFSMLGLAEGGSDLDTYIAKYVMQMGEDAIGALLNVVSVALRVNIQIVDLLKERDNQPKDVEVHDIHFHNSSIGNLRFSCPNDKLDFHNDMTLYVMRRTGHYDALYREEDFKHQNLRGPSALDKIGIQDEKFNELSQYFAKKEDGQSSNPGIFRCQHCQGNFQGNDIRNSDNLPFDQLLDPQLYPEPTCKNCRVELNEMQVISIFPDRFPSEVQNYFIERKRLREEKRQEEEKQRVLNRKFLFVRGMVTSMFKTCMRKREEEVKKEKKTIEEYHEGKLKEKVQEFSQKLEEAQDRHDKEKEVLTHAYKKEIELLQGNIKNLKEELKLEIQKSERMLLKEKETYQKFSKKRDECKQLEYDLEKAKKSHQSSKVLLENDKFRILKEKEEQKKTFEEENSKLRNKVRDTLLANQNQEKKYKIEKKILEKSENELKSERIKLQQQLSQFQNKASPQNIQAPYQNSNYMQGQGRTQGQQKNNQNQQNDQMLRTSQSQKQQNQHQNTLFPETIQQNSQNSQELQQQLQDQQNRISQLEQENEYLRTQPTQAPSSSSQFLQSKEEAQAIIQKLSQVYQEQTDKPTQNVLQANQAQKQPDFDSLEGRFQLAQKMTNRMKAEELIRQNKVDVLIQIFESIEEQQKQILQTRQGGSMNELQAIVGKFSEACDWKQLQEQVEKTNQEKEKLQQEYDALKSDRSNFEKQTKTYQLTLDEKQQEITQLQNSLEEKEKYVQKRKESFSEYYNEGEQIKKQNQVLLTQNSELESQLQWFQQKLQELQEASRKQQNNNQDQENDHYLQNQLYNEKQKVESLETRNATLKQEIEDEKDARRSLSRDKRELQSQIEILRSQIQMLEEQITGYKQEIQDKDELIKKKDDEIQDIYDCMSTVKQEQQEEQQQSSIQSPKKNLSVKSLKKACQKPEEQVIIKQDQNPQIEEQDRNQILDLEKQDVNLDQKSNLEVQKPQSHIQNEEQQEQRQYEQAPYEEESKTEQTNADSYGFNQHHQHHYTQEDYQTSGDPAPINPLSSSDYSKDQILHQINIASGIPVSASPFSRTDPHSTQNILKQAQEKRRKEEEEEIRRRTQEQKQEEEGVSSKTQGFTAGAEVGNQYGPGQQKRKSSTLRKGSYHQP